MADGPSREERRAYFNAGKDDYYYNQENVEFPKAQQNLYQQVAQRGQALDQWAFNQQQAKDAYKDQVKYQTESYKNQIKAFEKSDQIYNQNQKYIQGAYNNKVGLAQASYDETVRAAFYETDAAQRQLDINTVKAKNDTNDLSLTIDSLVNQKSINALNVEKIDNSIQNNNQKIQNTKDVAQIQKSQNSLDSLTNSRDLTLQRQELEEQNNLIDKKIADVATVKSQRMQQIDLTYKEQVQSSMAQLLDNNLKSIADQGSARARGQRGASVQRNIAGIIATSGVNGARLSAGILRSDEVRSLEKSQAEQNAKEQVDQLSSNSVSNTLKINRLKNNQVENVEEFKLKDALITEDAQQATQGYNKANRDNWYDKQQRGYEWNNIQNDISSKQNQQNLIAEQLGFQAEQLDMTREQLGESILSAKDSTENTISNLKRLANQENVSAFYQRMARPKFTALPKPPLDVPMPKFAPIYKMGVSGGFLNAADSGYLQATRPASGPSGMSKALQIGATALSIAAIPFTGGASAIGLGSLGSIGAAQGLQMGAALLGGAGKSGLFD